MSIRAVFRVQCDGPCRGWLSLPENYVPGTDLMPGVLVTEPTAVRAGLWPEERAAKRAAVGSGWRPSDFGSLWACPPCLDKIREDRVCVCTHPKSDHNLNDLCIALPGVLGCGCLGYLGRDS